MAARDARTQASCAAVSSCAESSLLALRTQANASSRSPLPLRASSRTSAVALKDGWWSSWASTGQGRRQQRRRAGCAVAGARWLQGRAQLCRGGSARGTCWSAGSGGVSCSAGCTVGVGGGSRVVVSPGVHLLGWCVCAYAAQQHICFGGRCFLFCCGPQPGSCSSCSSAACSIACKLAAWQGPRGTGHVPVVVVSRDGAPTTDTLSEVPGDGAGCACVRPWTRAVDAICF